MGNIIEKEEKPAPKYVEEKPPAYNVDLFDATKKPSAPAQ